MAAAGKLTWRPVPAETTGAATDGDTLEILALEETAIYQAVVVSVHSMDWALVLFNEGIENILTDWTCRPDKRSCWGCGRSRGGFKCLDLAFRLKCSLQTLGL